MRANNIKILLIFVFSTFISLNYFYGYNIKINQKLLNRYSQIKSKIEKLNWQRELFNQSLNKFNNYLLSPSSNHLFTAKEKLDTAKLIATTFVSDADLKAIMFYESVYFNDDSIDGRAPYITYYFHSNNKGFFSVSISSFFTYLDTLINVNLDSTLNLNFNFVDSDIISDTVEANGGTEFRYDEGKLTSVFYELKNYPENDIGSPDNINPYWKVTYSKSDTNYQNLEFLIFYLDPLTGQIISKINFSFDSKYTVKEKFSIVDSLAKNYDANAKLMYAVGLEDSLVDGKSFFLSYGYLGSNDKKFSVNLLLGYPVIDDSSGWLFDDLIITKEINLLSYLDSDTLMYISEINGGQAFRDSIIIESIGFLYVQSPLDTSNIYFHGLYFGTNPQTGNQTSLINLINPITGQFVNSILLKNDDEINLLPSEFNLAQNYPNPFNATTKISYTLSKPSFVQLKIYDVQGREIKTLASEFLPAGTYEITFDASELSSGIYFYSLSANGINKTRKMVLVK